MSRTRQDDAPDRVTRQAALWATLVAVPLTALVATLGFTAFDPADAGGPDSPPASTPGSAPTGAVPVSVRPLADEQARACRALLSQLPPTIRDLTQRPVRGGPEQNAAWGDPPLVLSCGVPAPVVPAGDDRWMVNRVCWHAVERADATVLTTVDRVVPVQVTVPRAHTQPLQWVAPISDVLVSTVRSVQPTPAGCGG